MAELKTREILFIPNRRTKYDVVQGYVRRRRREGWNERAIYWEKNENGFGSRSWPVERGRDKMVNQDPRGARERLKHGW